MGLESSFTELATVYLELQIKPQSSFNLAFENKQLNKTLALSLETDALLMGCDT